jgi:small conductance mechanosensitive channel
MKAPDPRFDADAVFARLMEDVERWLAAAPLFVVGLVVILTAWFIGGWLSKRHALERVGKRNPFLRDLARTTVRWGITLIGVLIALEVLNATAIVGAILGTAGVLGVALGFAFKDILENYLAGVLLSLRQPFKPRDLVEIDGNEGHVIALTSRATILMTLDGNHLRLPNALVFRSVALNYTRNPTRRFGFEVGIGVGEDLVHAQRVGIEALRTVPGVVDTPPPRAFVIGLGESSVQMRYHGWVDQRSHDYLLVRSEAVRIVKEALDAQNVDLPEPIYRVRLDSAVVAGPSDPGAAQAAPQADRPQRPAGPPIDTRSTGDLTEQINQEVQKRGGADLLDNHTPLE